MPFESSKALQQYSLVTASYWAFTLTDGALRMYRWRAKHKYGALRMYI